MKRSRAQLRLRHDVQLTFKGGVADDQLVDWFVKQSGAYVSVRTSPCIEVDTRITKIELHNGYTTLILHQTGVWRRVVKEALG